jgi:hypothetical protein
MVEGGANALREWRAKIEEERRENELEAQATLSEQQRIDEWRAHVTQVFELSENRFQHLFEQHALAAERNAEMLHSLRNSPGVGRLREKKMYRATVRNDVENRVRESKLAAKSAFQNLTELLPAKQSSLHSKAG